ncbi:hypothetical protein [Rhodococcus sp. B50]|uniref:hypothetical protein n=1 Tax=Rhodococcus sp. B50 TaxID=2682847 RepID=UPI001BD5318C|nr:hypothetical protein [Rhodococcus sp. B50]MBS9375358.1 hypothetical protein [Rhodococcus sp. B50]
MAVRLTKRWKLAVLRVRLDLSGRTPAVRSTLTAFPDGDERQFWDRRDPLEDFGLRMGSVPPRRLRVAAGLRRAVESTLTDELRMEPSLWLRLSPPYGFLGVVPWEELGSRIHLPVLRVPNSLPVAVELGRRWSIAILLDTPAGQRWGARHIRDILHQMDVQMSTPFEVDIFVDIGTYELLAADPGFASAPNIRLHMPTHDLEAHERRLRRKKARSAARGGDGKDTVDAIDDRNLVWTNWTLDGLHGRAVRAVHIVGEGAFHGEIPMLTYRPRPTATGFTDRRFAPAEEVIRLADMTGATLVSLGSPPTRHSDAAVRMLADTIGRTRPGPTLYCSLTGDRDAAELVAAHAFIADARTLRYERDHRNPFASRSLFGYIPPETVVDHEPLSWPVVPQALADDVATVGPGRTPISSPSPAAREVQGRYDREDTAPAWVASALRFVERNRAAVNTRSLAVPNPRDRARAEGIERALSEIEELTARYSRRQ